MEGFIYKMKRGKLGQIELSFGVIFSIILIIAFIAVAIYAIMMFLSTKKCAEIGLFKNDLQEAVNAAWNGEETNTDFKRSLPVSLDFACFIDTTKPEKGNYHYYNNVTALGKNFNMFFWPIKNACKGQGTFNIEHINLEKITESKNPYCIQNVNGKTTIKIEKRFSEMLVKLE